MTESAGVPEGAARKPRVRRGFLLFLLCVFVLPPVACVTGIFLYTHLVVIPKGRAITQAHGRLHPGLPLRDTLAVLEDLAQEMHVMVTQDGADSSKQIQWTPRRRGNGRAGQDETQEAFAARVRPTRPLHVYLAPAGSRQEFTIELDDARGVLSVSPVKGHAD
jgi:hypothetical protein